MTKPYGSLAVVALVALAASGGCEFKNTRSGATPSPVAATTASPATANALAGTWTSQMVATTAATTATAAPAIESCRNFKWVAGAQSATSASGDFTLTCNGTIPLSGSASAQMSGTSVQITVTGTATLPGVGACAFSLSGNGTLVNADTLRVPYAGTTCVGPVAGNETLLRNQVFPAPPTPPTPPPAPEPPPPLPPAPLPVPVPVGADQIDMSQATILNSPRDLASWNVSTRITEVDLTPNGVHLEVSPDILNGPHKWPEASFGVQYTLGMCLNISSKWYCSAVVQFWTGLPVAGGPPNEYAANWFYDAIRWSPMTGHQPAVGETIGFFACMGDCRNNTKGDLSPLHERTNVVLVQMPGPGGAVFRF